MKKKYTEQMANLFSEVFCWLPLAHVLNGKVLVVHGGLFAQDGVRLDDIRAIDRNKCFPVIKTEPFTPVLCGMYSDKSGNFPPPRLP